MSDCSISSSFYLQFFENKAKRGLEHTFIPIGQVLVVDLTLLILLGYFDPKLSALEYYYHRFAFKSNWDGTIQYLEVRWCWFYHIFIRQTLLRLAEHTCWHSLETHCDFLGLTC